MTRFDWLKFMDAVKLKRDFNFFSKLTPCKKYNRHKITTYPLNNIPAASFSDFNKLLHPHTTQFNFNRFAILIRHRVKAVVNRQLQQIWRMRALVIYLYIINLYGQDQRPYIYNGQDQGCQISEELGRET